MKKFSLLTILILAMALVACSDKGTSDDKKEPEATKEVQKVEFDNLSQLYTELSKVVEFNPMFEVTDEYALNLFGIDTTSLDDKVLYISEDVMTPDTVIIVKSSSADTRTEIEELLKGYVESKLVELEDYDPASYEIVKKCEVKTSGDYVYLIITSDVDAANDFLGNNL